MNIRIRFLFVSAYLGSALCAFPFSREGHEAIGELAYESPQLKPTAKAAIDRILGQETIMFAAEWPDAIKPPFGALANTPEAKAFHHAHPNNHLWHFVNFPIGSTAYAASSPYASPTDIAHAIKGCIAVLEGTGDFDGLSKLEALRFLVHLVGDAHQPLHTAFELFDVHDPAHPVMLPPSPTVPTGALRDGGGNDLYYSAKEELHADWDDGLVAAIVSSKKTADLVNALRSEVRAKDYKASGNYHQWVDAWLADTMALVPSVFAGITYDQFVEVSTGHGKFKKKILITLPPNYQSTHVAEAKLQVVKGADHLLQLFNAMHWAK